MRQVVTSCAEWSDDVPSQSPANALKLRVKHAGDALSSPSRAQVMPRLPQPLQLQPSDADSQQQLPPAAKRRRIDSRSATASQPALPAAVNGTAKASGRADAGGLHPAAEAESAHATGPPGVAAAPANRKQHRSDLPPAQLAQDVSRQLQSPAVATPSLAEPLPQRLADATDVCLPNEGSTGSVEEAQSLRQDVQQPHPALQQQLGPLGEGLPRVQLLPLDSGAKLSGADGAGYAAGNTQPLPQRATDPRATDMLSPAAAGLAGAAAAGVSPAASADAVGAQLAGAWAHFQEHRSEPQHLQFHE